MLSQVDLLLGKAYSDWGHISDAVTVYDKLITEHPEDFRGYLAKVIIKCLLFAVARSFKLSVTLARTTSRTYNDSASGLALNFEFATLITRELKLSDIN
jgi:hypothetical protein